jgi:Ran GTPase-activating protein (RanGAP) involved in mRNA processing and transport
MKRRMRKVVLHLRVQPWESAVIAYLRRQNDAIYSNGGPSYQFSLDKLRALQLMELRDDGASQFSSAISSGFIDQLQALQVQCSPSMQLGYLRALMEAFTPRSLPKLRSLDLSGSKLGDEIVVDIATMFKRGQLAGLESFSLASNAVQDAGCRKLVAALCHSDCRAKLRSLNLNGNLIANEGARALFNGLTSECLAGLRWLHLGDNLIPAGAIVENLSKAIQSRSCLKWQTIDLGLNSEVGDEGLFSLFEKIGGRDLCSGLRQIKVQSTNMGDIAAEALGVILASGTCKKLSTLDVSTNAISLVGARHLFEGFEGCPQLKSFSIANNDIGGEGFRILSDALIKGHGRKLERLDVSYTNYSTGIQLIARAIAQLCCPNLRELGVLDHSRSGTEIAQIFRACKHMNSLRLKS